MSFRAKILTLVAGSTLLPVLAMGFYSLHSLTDNHERSTQQLLESVVETSAWSLHNWLTEQQSTAGSMARVPSLRSALQSYRNHQPQDDEAYLDLFRIYRVLELCNDSSQWITEVRLLGKDARTILSDNEALMEGINLPARSLPELQTVVETGMPLVTRVQPAGVLAPIHMDSDELGKGFPTAFILTPVKGDSQLLGVLSARLAIQDLGMLLPREAGSLPVHVFLVNGKSLQDERKGSVDLLCSTRERALTDAFRFAQPIPQSNSNTPWPQPGYNMDGFLDYTGKQVVGAWYPVPNAEQLVVMACLDVEPFRHEMRAQRQGMIFFALASALLASLLALVLARALLRPLRTLANVSESLASGDRTARANLPPTDELGMLGQTFDQMAAAMSATLDQLEQARDEAMHANRAKSRFLANMTHELRTPLNAIIGYSEMIIAEVGDRGPGEETLLEDLNTILTAGRHLLEVINGILDLSKIEAGKMDVHWEDFALEELAKEVLVTLQPLAAEHQNKIESDLQHPGGVHLDRMKLKQVLFNLLSNACKFTKKGTITLGSTRDARDLVVSVSDTGIGMNAEQQKRVFEEFAQADDSTTRNYGGTGLGLTIVRRFTEMMGGTVRLRSAPGQGSTFSLHFPVQAAGEGICHILVIDDDADMRTLLERLLLPEGYQVKLASSGAQGLEMARAARPDVILLDVLLGEMSGWTVLQRLKEDPLLADVPVLMLTMVEDAQLGYALGAAEYLSKPVDRTRLIRILQRYRGSDGPVLVVDDDASMRRLVRNAMEGLSRTIVEAENGRQGLQRLAEQTPGLILLDLMMPELDGFGFLTELRKNPAWQNIPVIVMTSKELSATERQWLEEQSSRVLDKSGLGWTDLRRVLSTLLPR